MVPWASKGKPVSGSWPTHVPPTCVSLPSERYVDHSDPFSASLLMISAASQKALVCPPPSLHHTLGRSQGLARLTLIHPLSHPTPSPLELHFLLASTERRLGRGQANRLWSFIRH